MAEFNSREYAKVQSTPVVKLAPNEYGGELRVASVQTPATAAWAANDTVRGVTIPEGSRVVGFTVNHGAFGSSVTLDAGDGTDADRFFDGLDVSSAGQSYVASKDTDELTADTPMVFSLLDANPTDNAQFTVFVHFVKT